MRHTRVLVTVFCIAVGLLQAPSNVWARPQQPTDAARVAATADTAVPRLLQFNGTLKDTASRPVSGAASVTFAIYSEQDGGAPLWSETQNVMADSNGHYNALLGGATSNGMPAELFGTGQSRWLGVTIARQPEMPRVLLASVPYALKAGDAETLGGLPASEYVTTKSLATSNARVPAPVVARPTTTILTAPQVGVESASAATPAAVPQATPTGTGKTDFIPIWTSTSALGSSTIFESAGLVGIGTTTPAETLDVNGNSIFRGSFQLPPGHEATAASGFESHSFQFQSSSFNSSTKTPSDKAFGFRAEPLGNNTSNPSSKLDLFFGGAGGTLTDTGFSWSSTGIVTFASGQTFSGASTSVNELNLPNTSGSSVGVVNIGGVSFLSDAGATTNTFVGRGAGGSGEVSGASDSNTAVGNGAMASNQTGISNTAAGASALQAVTSGSYNSGFGVQALNFEATGGSNTAVGFAAGLTDQSGAFNTFIGANADASGTNFTHATAIGAGAMISESNAIVLGGIGQTAVNVGIGSSSPGHTLEVVDRGVGGAGIWTLSNTAGDNAVEGIQSATSGLSNGGYFATSSSVGTGVVGVNTAGGKAGYFAGDVQVTGNVSKMGGSFKIDDPIAPSEKYLSHSFVESPDMMNIYNGNVVTNSKGYAVVTMPEWFEALNQDFRYQLTTVGVFSQSMISSEIKDRKFIIRTSKPNVKVSWMVTGIRHDAWANAHRIPTEEEKPANEQGRYLHPELFGAGPDQAIVVPHPVPSADTQHAAQVGAH